MSCTQAGLTKTGINTTPRDAPTTTPAPPLAIQFPGDLRDWFAGQAMNGLLSNEDDESCPVHRTNDVEAWRSERLAIDASHCYRIADAMLAARGS